MQQVEEKYLISQNMELCKNCEWCIMQEFSTCLLKGKAVGLLNTCEYFKWKTGEHISMQEGK